MNTTLLLELQRILHEAKSGSITWTDSGICNNITGNRGCVEAFTDIAALWPKFSGRHAAPLPIDPTERADLETPYHAYTVHRDAGTLWTGKQLELRIELLEFCIAHLQEQRAIEIDAERRHAEVNREY